MAELTETVTAPARIFPWQGLNDPERVRSIVPRSDIRFLVVDQALTAQGSNTKRLDIQMPLPVGFAYAMSELHVKLVNDAGTAINYQDQGRFAMRDNTDWALTTQAIFQNMTAPGAIGAGYTGASKVWAVDGRIEKTIVQAQDDAGAVAEVYLFNTTNPDPINYSLYCFARFLMYDIDQAYHFEPNTPQLVR